MLRREPAVRNRLEAMRVGIIGDQNAMTRNVGNVSISDRHLPVTARTRFVGIGQALSALVANADRRGRPRLASSLSDLAPHELARAMRNGELELYYQPQVTATTGIVTGFEALVRWNHPTRGLVSPVEFIAMAEETGLIVPLGEWIIGEACRTATQWSDEISISINVSPIQLRSPGLVDTFRRVLASTGLSHARVEVEITESGFVDEPATACIHRLAALGVAIAVDDFGTGYSALSVLRTFPVTRVKIDRAFVAALSTDPGHGSRAMLAAIVSIGDALGLDTIAEGVETREQRAIVAEVGCPQIQGYLESRPLRRDAIASYLSSRMLCAA